VCAVRIYPLEVCYNILLWFRCCLIKVCKIYYTKFGPIFCDMWIFAANTVKRDAVHRSRSKVTRKIFLLKHPIQNFTKICPVAAKLVHADGWTDSNDEANSSFLQFCERTKKKFCKGCHRFCYLYYAYSYIQYINQEMHLIKYNKIQIIISIRLPHHQGVF